MKQNTFEETVNWGLNRADHHFQTLAKQLVKVLAHIGDDELADWVQQLLSCDKPADQYDAVPEKGIFALSLLLQFMNLSEEFASHETRRRREAVPEGITDSGLWKHTLTQLKEESVSAQEIDSIKNSQAIEIVFTKHPTEAKRWPVMGLHRELRSLLKKDPSDGFPGDAEFVFQTVIERLWRTGELFLSKPKVEDELENLLYYFKHIFPVALSILDQRFIHAWKQTLPDSSLPDQRPKIRFGCWVGGDRDGHPFVTAKVTEETLLKLRGSAIDIHKEHLKNLAEALPFQMDASVNSEAFEELQTKFPLSSDQLREPWKNLVLQIIDQLPDKKKTTEGYQHSADLIKDLRLVKQSLLESGANQIAYRHFDPVIRLVDAIGFHLAVLDIRENSDTYNATAAELFAAAGIEDGINFPNWPESRKIDFLNEELSNPRPLCHQNVELTEKAQKTMDTFRLISSTIQAGDPNAFGTLIISMTRSLSDLLTVYTLTKETGISKWENGKLTCQIPLVPLFETEADLKMSESIMRAYLNHPVTRNSYQKYWNGVSTVMLGYSDSNKDSGIIASQWALQIAQENLQKIATESEIPIKFFHGRGGTISRGSGPTHRFLEALPKGSLKAGLRLTEQGEVIAQKYNSVENASINLEYLAASVMRSTTESFRNKSVSDDWKLAFSTLSNVSKRSYRKLLESDGFMDFYRRATPIAAIEQSRIGSRPSRRSGAATLSDLRAIPWVFSWNQSRYFLPGWYGVGTALSDLAQNGEKQFETIQQKISSVPFLRYLFYNIETSYLSADREIFESYASMALKHRPEPQFFDIQNQIVSEFELTIKMIGQLFEQPVALRRPRLIRTIDHRKKFLIPIHKKQIELLEAWHQSAEDSEEKTKLLNQILETINAIASGLRATG